MIGSLEDVYQGVTARGRESERGGKILTCVSERRGDNKMSTCVHTLSGVTMVVVCTRVPRVTVYVYTSGTVVTVRMYSHLL